MSTKPGTVTLDRFELEELARPLKRATAIVQCAMCYACDPNDGHTPYLKPALDVAFELLRGVENEVDALQKRANGEKGETEPAAVSGAETEDSDRLLKEAMADVLLEASRKMQDLVARARNKEATA